MSFKVKLELDGKTYNVLACEYELSQSRDRTGLPEGMPTGGEIHLRLESTGEPDFFKWMRDNNETKDGKIIYYRRDAMSKLQELVFKKAFCVNFIEDFNANSTEPLQIELIISAQQLIIGGVSFEKQWKINL